MNETIITLSRLIVNIRELRDYVGWVWYERDFFVPKSWSGSHSVTIRFGSAHYTSEAWVNGHSVCTHSGGHLPFECEATDFVAYGARNRLTVAVNNTLTPTTVPQGKTVWKAESDRYPAGYSEMQYDFDFLNYAGIHRPVHLVAAPKDLRILDIRVASVVSDDHKTAIIYFDVDTYVVSRSIMTF